MRLAADIAWGSIAAFAGVLAGLVATPLYVRLLGQEGYGVIAFFLAAQSVLTIFDLGLPVTLNRAVAKSQDGRVLPALPGVLRLFWAQAVLLAVAVWALAGYLATSWLHPVTLSISTVVEALVAMGFALAARWPIAAYLAVLMGAQRIGIASKILVAGSLLAPAGAVLWLWAMGPDLRVVFGWFAICAVAQVLAMHAAAADLMPPKPWQGATRLVRESVPVGLTGVAGLLFNHADKAIVSRAVALEQFGHYMLAGLIAGVMYAGVTPVSNALYPRFSALEAAGRHDETRRLYRDSCHALACVVFPAALFMVVSGEALVLAWTQDPSVARGVAPLLAWMAAGAAVHAIMFATYSVSQACGLESLVLRINVQALAVSLPLTVFMAFRHGVEGAAIAWFASHIVYFALSAWQTHARVLPGQALRWLGADIGVPALVAVACGAIAVAVGVTRQPPALAQLASGLAASVVAFAALLAMSRRLRAFARSALRMTRPEGGEARLL